MKRSEMLERIEAEIRILIERYNQSFGAPKRQERIIKKEVRWLLYMLEEFGMVLKREVRDGLQFGWDKESDAPRIADGLKIGLEQSLEMEKNKPQFNSLEEALEHYQKEADELAKEYNMSFAELCGVIEESKIALDDDVTIRGLEHRISFCKRKIEEDKLILSNKDAKIVVDAVLNPSTQNEELKKAFKTNSCPKNYGSYDISTTKCSNCNNWKLYKACSMCDIYLACAGWNLNSGEACCCKCY